MNVYEEWVGFHINLYNLTNKYEYAMTLKYIRIHLGQKQKHKKKIC